MKTRYYTIDSFRWFPCSSVSEFYLLRMGNLDCTQILWYAVGVKLTPLIVFLN